MLSEKCRLWALALALSAVVTIPPVFHPGGRPTSSAEGDRQPNGLRAEAAVQKCL